MQLNIQNNQGSNLKKRLTFGKAFTNQQNPTIAAKSFNSPAVLVGYQKAMALTPLKTVNQYNQQLHSGLASNNNQSKEIRLQRLLQSGDLDAGQTDIYEKYKDNKDFLSLIKEEDYNYADDKLDAYRLVEYQYTCEADKSLDNMFNNNLKAATPQDKQLMDKLLAIAKQNPASFSDDQAKLYKLSSLNPKFKTLLKAKVKTFVDKDLVPQSMNNYFKAEVLKQQKYNQDAAKIQSCFDKPNEWTAKLAPQGQEPITTKQKMMEVKNLCDRVAKNQGDANTIFVMFFDNVLKTKQAMKANKIDVNTTIEDYYNNLPDNWHRDRSWYYTYVNNFGTDKDGKGDFKSFTRRLDYLDKLGVKNMLILPHYESPQGDAGYDISDYHAAKELGGEEEFGKFLKEAARRGYGLATDLVFNHTSTEHEWFKKAQEGYPKYFQYYLKCSPDWPKKDLDKSLSLENGNLMLKLPEKDKNGDMVISSKNLSPLFPDVDKSIWLNKPVNGLNKSVPFYRNFYPFQVDLDLQNPEVFNELYDIIGSEVAKGVAGKRLDAAAYFIKQPGTESYSLPQTDALQQLTAKYMKHLHPKTIIIPEVLRGNGKGDIFFDFRNQAKLREMSYLHTSAPFWENWDKTKAPLLNPDNKQVPLVIFDHHDEIYMNHFGKNQNAMKKFLTSTFKKTDRHGKPKQVVHADMYKGGAAAGGRMATCVNEDLRRITQALFNQFMIPGAPAFYYGAEIGTTNNREYMEVRKVDQYQILKKLLGPEKVGEDESITLGKCADPRELQRGPIEAAKFDKAEKQHYPAIDTIKYLNKLRGERSALRSYNIEKLQGNDDTLFAMIKYPEQGAKLKDGALEKPLVTISNLDGAEKTVNIPVKQMQKALNVNNSNISFNTLFKIDNTKQGNQVNVNVSDKRESTPASKSEDFIFVKLHPYSSLILEPIV